MVFTGKIDPETHAYIKFNRNTPVVELTKETKVSRAQIYKIKKEPLRTKIISKRLKGPGGRPEKLSVRDKRALLREIKALRRENGNWTGVKCIFFANRRENPSPYYKLLGILKLDNLIKFKTATFVSQIRNRDEIPELFLELLVPVSSVHSYNTRYASQDNYYQPAARTNYGKFSFKFFASQLWETIPVFLKSLPFNSFKKEYKNFLFYNRE